jgi:sugar phosphate isomerase/epimerase
MKPEDRLAFPNRAAAGTAGVELYLNTATIQPAPLERKLAIARRAGFDGVELFAEELAAFATSARGLRELSDLLGEHGLRVRRLLPPRHLFAWHAMTPRHLRERRAEFEGLFTLARGLGATAVILPVASDEGTVAAARENFATACDWARDFGLQLAYEPVGHTGKTSRVREAWGVVKEAGRANGGLFLDLFHFFRSGCGPEDLEGIPPARVLGVHLCDAIPLPRQELVGFRHRTVPGEGIIPVVPLVRLLWSAGYRDYFAVEILNPDLWAEDLQALATRAARACRAALAEAAGAADLRA